MNGKIIGQSGTYKGAEIPIETEIVIGRDPAYCNLILEGDSVSDRHCRITYDEKADKYYIENLSEGRVFRENGAVTLDNMRNSFFPGETFRIGNGEDVFECVASGKVDLVEQSEIMGSNALSTEYVQGKERAASVVVPQELLFSNVEEEKTEKDKQDDLKTLSRKEFYKLPELSKIRGMIIFSAIVCYLGAAMAFSQIFVIPFGAIISVGIFVTLGLFIQIKQSCIASIALILFGLLNMVLASMGGETGGWLYLLGGVDATYSTFKLKKIWEKYQKTGKI